ncbi:unnamed protein product [Amoebophrya sp. A25]|nr:unnamed protein product [Amoebophrya sp. A25]|eukprot:GSA25T00023865001.1
MTSVAPPAVSMHSSLIKIMQQHHESFNYESVRSISTYVVVINKYFCSEGKIEGSGTY